MDKKYPELVVGVFILCQGRLLLVRKVGSAHWIIPGGHIELNETAEMAAQREILEETAISLPSVSFVRHVLFNVKERHFFALDFVGRLDLPPEKIILNHELSHFKWFTIEEALAEPNVPPHIRKTISELKIF